MERFAIPIKLPVIIEPGNEFGFVATCPVLPGCYSQGDTYEDAMQGIRTAIKQHIDYRLKIRQPIPTNDSFRLENVDVHLHSNEKESAQHVYYTR